MLCFGLLDIVCFKYSVDTKKEWDCSVLNGGGGRCGGYAYGGGGASGDGVKIAFLHLMNRS